MLAPLTSNTYLLFHLINATQRHSGRSFQIPHCYYSVFALFTLSFQNPLECSNNKYKLSKSLTSYLCRRIIWLREWPRSSKIDKHPWQQTSLAPRWPKWDLVGYTLGQCGPIVPCYLGYVHLNYSIIYKNGTLTPGAVINENTMTVITGVCTDMLNGHHLCLYLF